MDFRINASPSPRHRLFESAGAVMGKLAKAIVRSIESEPERWGESLLSLKRDDGVELRYGKPFADGTVCTAMLVKPLRVTFGIMDRWRLKAAVENWAASIVDQPGPLTERLDHEP